MKYEVIVDTNLPFLPCGWANENGRVIYISFVDGNVHIDLPSKVRYHYNQLTYLLHTNFLYKLIDSKTISQIKCCVENVLNTPTYINKEKPLYYYIPLTIFGTLGKCRGICKERAIPLYLENPKGFYDNYLLENKIIGDYDKEFYLFRELRNLVIHSDDNLIIDRELEKFIIDYEQICLTFKKDGNK